MRRRGRGAGDVVAARFLCGAGGDDAVWWLLFGMFVYVFVVAVVAFFFSLLVSVSDEGGAEEAGLWRSVSVRGAGEDYAIWWLLFGMFMYLLFYIVFCYSLLVSLNKEVS